MEKEQQRLDMETKRGHKEHGKDRDKRQVWFFYLLGIAGMNVKLRGSWLTSAGLQQCILYAVAGKVAYATEVCVLCVKQSHLTGSVVAAQHELSMRSDCKQDLHWLTLRG